MLSVKYFSSQNWLIDHYGHGLKSCPEMTEKSSSSEGAAKEPMYGITSDVRILQQRSSPGKVAQEKREQNHKERVMGALESAIATHFQQGKQQRGSGSEKK